MFKSSPDHSLTLLSEIDAPLLSNSNIVEASSAVSAQYFKVPLEDRSKYEKLVTNNEVSSENSSDNENKNVKAGKIRKRRKIKNIPEKLQSVCKSVEIPIVKNFMSEKSKIGSDVNKKSEKEVGVESEDSIGSASDLRVYDDNIENHPNKGDEVSESIVTCGSSAYHAECESMATHEDDCISRVIRAKQKEEVKNKGTLAEDVLFVGHQYGEKPLLLDDELDSEPEVKEEFAQWSNKKDDLWIQPSSSIDDDVFAMAPFSKPKNKVRANVNQTQLHTEKNISVVDTTSQYSESYEAIQDADHHILATDVMDTISKSESCRPFVTSSLNPFLSNESLETATANVATISLPTFTTFTVSANIVTTEAQATTTHIHYYTEAHFPVNFRSEEVVNIADAKIVDGIVSTGVNTDVKPNIVGMNYHYNDPIEIQCKNPEKDVAKESKCSEVKPKINNFLNTPFENLITNESNIPKRSKTPELVYKAKKDKKKEKSKYQLIEERTTDDDLSTTSKTAKGTKKVSSKSSKKANSKAKTQGGFSNMSFEDYPSDEGEIVSASTTPFEVLRNPEQEEKRYGSLKRIGNPFS